MSAMAPPTSHAPRISIGVCTWRETTDGLTKMPAPMIPPITIIVASKGAEPTRERWFVVGGTQFLSRTNWRILCKADFKERQSQIAAPALLRKVIDFHQSHSSPAVFSRNDGGIHSRQQTRRHGGLEPVRRREAVRADLRRLVCILLPVIVRDYRGTLSVANIKRGIEQRICYTRLRERRTEPTNDKFRRAAIVANNESADQHIPLS